MSTFQVAVRVGNIDGSRWDFVEALVDTGASHSIFPGRLLRELGVEATERWPFRFADQRQRDFDVGTARIRMYDRERFSPVVFGDDSMQPILGAITLEEFGLGVDPVGHTLVPVPGLIMTLLQSD